MRYVPIVLLFGIFLNFSCVLIFRLKLDRKMNNDFKLLADSLQSQLVSFSSDALKQIDDYFFSNRVSRSSSFSDSPASSSPEDILCRDSGEWDYSYMKVNNIPFARVGIVDFSIGSRFPRGGFITAIYPDCVIVNDTLSFRNRSFRSSFPSSSQPLGEFEKPFIPDTTYKPNKELTDYVKRTRTMRK